MTPAINVIIPKTITATRSEKKEHQKNFFFGYSGILNQDYH